MVVGPVRIKRIGQGLSVHFQLRFLRMKDKLLSIFVLRDESVSSQE
jgi:hypothetical protein